MHVKNMQASGHTTYNLSLEYVSTQIHASDYASGWPNDLKYCLEDTTLHTVVYNFSLKGGCTCTPPPYMGLLLYTVIEGQKLKPLPFIVRTIDPV